MASNLNLILVFTLLFAFLKSANYIKSMKDQEKAKESIFGKFFHYFKIDFKKGMESLSRILQMTCLVLSYLILINFYVSGIIFLLDIKATGNLYRFVDLGIFNVIHFYITIL